jgi:hypothetical protein
MMTDPEDSESGTLEWRTRAFFDYWRRRRNFIEGLDLKENIHEANVLLWAAIDALSNLWGRNLGRNHVAINSKRVVFDAFLARYGGDYFQLVSLPDVWHRASCHPEGSPVEYRSLCQTIGRSTPDPNGKLNRHTSDDPELISLVGNIQDSCGLTDPNLLCNWLRASRYGSLAYKSMRSFYIHEGRPGRTSHSFQLHDSDVSPTYLSNMNASPGVIGVSQRFMLSVLDLCILTFERESLELQMDPSPP